jgi:hypothetical protein
MKPGPIHKKSHELKTEQTTDKTQNQNTQLQFLTPVTQSVTKTVNLRGFDCIRKQMNINVLFSQFLAGQRKTERRNFKAGFPDGIFLNLTCGSLPA